jgi:hypothetical protein
MEAFEPDRNAIRKFVNRARARKMSTNAVMNMLFIDFVS